MTFSRLLTVVARVFVLGVVLLPCLAEEAADRRVMKPFAGGFTFETRDVVVFLGGANVVAAQETGHLETLLTLKFPGRRVRYRNMGWEGDTVYAQPRDLNFPPLKSQLQRVGATVLLLQFGQTEALRGTRDLPDFIAAYERMLDEFSNQTQRIVLVTPPPFERGGPLVPDLSIRNQELGLYARAIRELARRRGYLLVDLYHEFGELTNARARLTENGLHLTAQGHAVVARSIVRQLGLGDTMKITGAADAKGAWPIHSCERVRRATVEKNRLWFDYWRPMNWAFLGGDRTEQPSSRDHRNPKVRWFPAEMEKFVPLIEQAEARIDELAAAAIPE